MKAYTIVLAALLATSCVTGAEHAPRGGPDGARAVIFRVHVEGKDERTLVGE